MTERDIIIIIIVIIIIIIIITIIIRIILCEVYLMLTFLMGFGTCQSSIVLKRPVELVPGQIQLEKCPRWDSTESVSL